MDISVIVPVHNSEIYLEACLKTLHEQTHQAAEFIVIDDGSDDKSGAICDAFAAVDKRFVVIHQKPAGTLVTRKRAFALATGKWCICLDADDKLPFNRVLEIEVKLANHHDVDILRFDMECFGATPEKIKNYLNFRKEWQGSIHSPYLILDAIYNKAQIGWGMADKIYRTATVHKTLPFLEEPFLCCGTDCYQLFLISYFSSTFKSIKTEPLYSYRIGSGISTSETNLDKFKEQAKILFIPNYLRDFLTKEQQLSKYEAMLSALSFRLIDATISRFDLVQYPDSNSAFDLLLLNPSLIKEVIEQLIRRYQTNQLELAEKISESRIFEGKPKKIKRVGIFYHRYFNGGTEKVIFHQIPLLIENGFEIFLITEIIDKKQEYFLPSEVKRICLPKEFQNGRAQGLFRALQHNKIDLIIYHAPCSPTLFFDNLVVRSCGSAFIVTCHNFAPSTISLFSPHWGKYSSYFKTVDALITLTSVERDLFSAYEIPSFLIPNPLFPPICAKGASDLEPRPSSFDKNKKHIIWIGRLENIQKNYIEAMEIFKNICSTLPDVTCHIIGKGETPLEEKYVRQFISDNDLEQRIIYEGVLTSADKCFKYADIHLMTSTFECFPMVLSEAMSYGVPTVLYEMPYLELIKNNKGCISVPRHHVEKASQEILRLLTNETERHDCSQKTSEAYRSYLASNLSHIQGLMSLIHKIEEARVAKPQRNDSFIELWESFVSFQTETNYQPKVNIKEIQISAYDQKKISRYDNCLSFFLNFAPKDSYRYSFSKRIAKWLYSIIKDKNIKRQD